MRPNLVILPPAQRSLWPELRAVPHRFVLYGGTAIALHLGHRASVDFDFFASEALDMQNLAMALPWLGQGTTIQLATDTYSVIVERDGAPVKLSFFGDIKTGRAGDDR
jgi:hypothetical protein